MKHKLYRLCISAVIIASMMTGITACAKTPDEKIVKQKNAEKLREEAKKTPDEDSTLKATAEKAPEHYNYSYENDDKSLVVKADADVWLPDNDTIPMYEVTSEGYSQEFATAAYNFFFKGRETYILEGTDMTKSRIKEMIVNCKQAISEIEADTSMTDEERQNSIEGKNTEIEYWEGLYDDAPEKSTLHKVPVDDKIKLLENYSTENEKDKVYGVECNTDTEYFSLTNFPVDSSGWPGFLYSRDSEWSYYPDEGVELDTDELKENAKKDIGISIDEARAKADSFFDSVGVDVKCIENFGVQGYKTKVVSDNKFEDAETETSPSKDYTAYKFTYTRVVDGIPIAATTNDYLPDDDATLVWCYERMNVTVDKDGIISMNWEYPADIKESVSDNVGIISFDEAKKTFEKMMPVIYEGKISEWNDENNTMTIDVDVNQVSISLMRVRDSGSERKGVYSPAWIFYGKVIEHHKSYNEYTDKWDTMDMQEQQPWIVLAINAVDGSVIDVVEGY